MFTSSLTLASLAILATAQSTTTSSGITSTTTSPPDLANAQDALTGIIFLDHSSPADGFSASLLCADSTATTYELRCAQTSPAANTVCVTDPSFVGTITARSSNYDYQYTTRALRGSGLVTQSCDFGGPSASASTAVCSLSAWLVLGAARTSPLLSSVETVTASDFPPALTIATGDGTLNTQSACSATPTSISTRISNDNDGSPTPSRAGESSNAAPTAMAVDVYKVLIPAGAAALAYAL